MEREAEEQRLALATLAIVAKEFPQQRLCQLIVNATGFRDPFHVTDIGLADALIRFHDAHANPK